MVRTSLTWRILGENLVGTCHIPTPGRAGGLSGAPSAGILLLNPGSAPRSGNSDLSTRIGDRLALRGFPVFRFDLFGLGDSSGTTPADLDAYWNQVVRGRNDQATVRLIDRIQCEFGVARVIVGGLCAAILPSIRALDHGGSSPAGLILLEPNFRLTTQDQPVGARHATDTGALQGSAAALGRISAALGLGRDGPIARTTRLPRAFLAAVKQRVRATLPKHSNLPPITRWQASFAHGVRSLVIVAAEGGNDRYVTRILASMPSRGPEAVFCVRVPATNHLFTGGAGREVVLAAVESWMMKNFGSQFAPAVRPASGS